MDQVKPFNILLVERNPEVSKMIAFAIESQFGASVFEAPDAERAIAFLNTISEITTIILGDALQDQEVLELARQHRPTPLKVAICVNQKIHDPTLLLEKHVIGVARRSNFVEEVLQLLRDKIFAGDVVTAGENAASEFATIRPQLLVIAPPLTADVYIRLSETKFLKIFRRGDVLEASDVEKYWKERHIDFFHVRRTESAGFLAQFTAEVNKLVHQEHVESTAVRALGLAVHETVYETINKLGVTQEVRDLTQSTIKLVVKSIGNQPTLSSVFDRIHREMGHYIVSHSLALAEISCIFAANVEWASDLTFNKLILASLFHDITIKSHELARAASLEQAQAPNLLILDSLDDFRLHPLNAANTVNSLDNVPADVDLIIRQHHEKPDGTGFPQGISNQYLSPLSSLFIISHDFLDFCHEAGNDLSISAFLQCKTDQYAGGHFKKIAKMLLSANGSPRT